MGSLVVIQFWTLAHDRFHAREAKRLFGIIGAGGTLANVIFGLLVSRYARRIGAPNLLWLMVVQLAACALLARAGARLISTAPLIGARRTRRTVPVLSRAGLAFLGNRHLMLVAAAAAVSAAAVTVVDFQFKLAAAAVLPQNELAGYFGRFYGICGGIALAVQIWITGRLLERHGILAALLPLPAGLALGSGFSAALPNPGLFVVSLAKGSDTIFRYTINDASMQLLYVPVQPSVRGRAKAFIDGILKPTAIALTGVVLLFYKQSGGKGRPLTLPCGSCSPILLPRSAPPRSEPCAPSSANRQSRPCSPSSIPGTRLPSAPPAPSRWCATRESTACSPRRSRSTRSSARRIPTTVRPPPRPWETSERAASTGRSWHSCGTAIPRGAAAPSPPLASCGTLSTCSRSSSSSRIPPRSSNLRPPS